MPSKAKQAPVVTVAPYTLQTLTVRQVHVLDAIQPRSDLNTMVVEEYATLYREAEGDDPLPPIDVFQVGNKHFVSDGFHRLEAAKRASRKEIACHVYAGSQQEAMRHGVFANLKRGLAYSHGDRERILERLLQDPDVSQRSDRALARDLGLSHVTVGRARHRLAAVATLEEEWHAVPLTQTTDGARRQEQIATFLEADPQLVASYEKVHPKVLDTDTTISWVARRMTDSNVSQADAKAGVRTYLQKEVREWEQAREWRRQFRPPKETPEARAKREAAEARLKERERREQRDQHMLNIVQRFVALHDGIRESWGGGPCTFADVMAALSPESRDKLPDLLSQAEVVIQALKDALTAPEQQDVPHGEAL